MWLGFLWIQVPSHLSLSYTHAREDESSKVTPLPAGTECRSAGCVFIVFRCRRQRKVGEERHELLSELHGAARQKSPTGLPQCTTVHTGKPFKYQNYRRLASSTPSSHTFPSNLWYIIARSSFSPNNTLGTQNLHPDLHSFFLPSTQKIPFLSLIVNPASPTKSSSPHLLLHTVNLPRN